MTNFPFTPPPLSQPTKDNYEKDNLIAQPDTSIPDRSSQTKVIATDPAPVYVTLEQIDDTLLNYIQNNIQLTVDDNGRIVPVPIIYANPEMWKAIRKDGFMRDPQQNKLQTPIMTIRRTSIRRNNLTNPSNKYVYYIFQNQWNSRNAYDRFAVTNGIRRSQQLNQVIVPDYVDLTYEVIIWTEYQSQLNKLIEAINVENQEWWGLRNQYKFRVRIDNYDNQNELPPSGEERFVRAIFNMNVAAYLIPERMVKNFQPTSTNTTQYTPKKVVIREVPVTGDEFNP